MEGPLVREEDERSPEKAQEMRPIAETITISTQTCEATADTIQNYMEEDTNEFPNDSLTSELLSDDKKSLCFWSVSEESGLAEVCKDDEYPKLENPSSDVTFEYETIISNLEANLEQTRTDLDAALKTKDAVEKDCARALEDLRIETHKEKNILQEKIVRICTSVLEKFGPYALCTNKKHNRVRSSGFIRSCGNSSSKLRKKLNRTTLMLNKVKLESKIIKQALEEKSRKYDVLQKYFDRLTKEMEVTSMSLNNIIAENATLREKVESMKLWLEFHLEKDKQEKSNKVQFKVSRRKSELLNLRRRSEEDFATILELRNRLFHLESTNTNKEFLLNSYKSQLAELHKEKHQFLARINILENEIKIIRNIYFEVSEW